MRELAKSRTFSKGGHISLEISSPIVRVEQPMCVYIHPCFVHHRVSFGLEATCSLALYPERLGGYEAAYVYMQPCVYIKYRLCCDSHPPTSTHEM